MVERDIVRDLAKVIQHTELNKAGWLTEAYKQIILYFLWVNGNEIAIESLVESIEENFDIEVNKGIFKKAISELDSQVRVRVDDKRVSITKNEKVEFEERVETYEGMEGKCKSYFDQLKEEHGLKQESFNWEDFTEDIINPLVHEHGVMFYEMVGEGQEDRIELQAVSNFVENNISDKKELGIMHLTNPNRNGII